MDSKFAKIYTALAGRIKAQVPEIKWIDIDAAQLEVFETRPAVLLPCVLIDFPQTNYTEKNNRFQHGNTLITFKVAFQKLENTNAETPQAIGERGLKYFETEHKLFLALQDYNADGNLNIPLVRLSCATQLRDDNLRVRIITYKATFQDTY